MLAEFLFCGELLADSTNISLPDMLAKILGRGSIQIYFHHFVGRKTSYPLKIQGKIIDL